MVNHFGNYSGTLGSMLYYTGKDLNDLGRYEQCDALDETRYITFALTGLPLGVFLGICGPIECA